MRNVFLLPLLILFLVLSNLGAAPPKVDIVVSDEASSLELMAASDVAADLKKIYDAQVSISSKAPVDAEHLIYVGRLESIPAVKEPVAVKWPNLGEQDHFLLTIQVREKPALVVGGRSAQGTYWAAAEYAHSLGVRSMLFGDLYPANPKPFSLENYDHLLRTAGKNGTWIESDPFPTGFTAWGLSDAKGRLRQLARLKFSAIQLQTHPSQSWGKHSTSDQKNEPHDSPGSLWFGWRFPVSGDTAGRSAFRGAKFFNNPDFEGAETQGQRRLAGDKWLKGLSEHAAGLGMNLQAAHTVDLAQKPSVHRPLVSDENLMAYQMSRNRFGESLSLETACSSMIDPIFGGGVSGSIRKAIDQMRKGTELTEENDAKFSLPAPDMILKHYSQNAAAPDWWSTTKGLYLGAMNDMYRANSRARDGGRSYSLYLARRCEFGFEYVNCIDAVRKSALAREKKDRNEQRAHLEKAVESINGACSALAAVARDPSDRGMIAVLNEFGYRPLQKELEKLEE